MTLRALRLVAVLVLAIGSTESLSALPGDRIQISDDLYLYELAHSVWMHVSQITIPAWGNVWANGLVVRADNQAFLVETPWNNDQTGILVEWIETNFEIPVTDLIATHYHDDCIGGLSWIHKQGINSYSFSLTREICRSLWYEIPKESLGIRETLTFSEVRVQTFFPGENHTVDCLSVYLPDLQILFGGCSVKSLDNWSVGNTADANMDQWPNSLEMIRSEFPNALTVVPGHGKPGGLELLDYTIALFQTEPGID